MWDAIMNKLFESVRRTLITVRGKLEESMIIHG